MATTGSDTLSWFEVPRPFIEPVLRALRLGNTALDTLFYDVNTVVADLLLHGSIVVAGGESTVASAIPEMTKAFSSLDLTALSNPEGSILVVDSGRPPHVTPFEDVRAFLSWVNAQGQKRQDSVCDWRRKLRPWFGCFCLEHLDSARRTCDRDCAGIRGCRRHSARAWRLVRVRVAQLVGQADGARNARPHSTEDRPYRS